MAMKVLAISATPRPKGNSDIFLDHVIAGCREKGADVTKVRLRDLSMTPCIGCDVCQDTVTSACVIDDDIAEVLSDIRAASALVFAGPIYFGSVNAQMKILLDRMYALFGGGDFTTVAGKRVALALTYGDQDPLQSGVMNALRMFQDATRALCMPLVGCVHCACMQPGEILEKPEVLARATALGRILVDCKSR